MSKLLSPSTPKNMKKKLKMKLFSSDKKDKDTLKKLKSQPPFCRKRFHFGLIYFGRKQYQVAFDLFQPVRNHWNSYFFLAMCTEKLGGSLTSAYELYHLHYQNTKDDLAAFRLSVVCEKLRRNREAQQWMKKARKDVKKLESLFMSGIQSLGSKKYEETFGIFSKLVTLGHLNSSYYLGYLYLHGYGCRSDKKKALEQFLRLEETNCILSLNYIGSLYHNGEGVEQDFTKAVHFYKKAVALGSDLSMSNLALMYESGSGPIELNYCKAIEWYDKSFEHGYLKGMYFAGQLYFYGRCTLQEDDPAHLCSPETHCIKRNYKKALECYQRGASRNCSDCINEIGYCYDQGLGYPQDFRMAFRHFKKAASMNHEIALYNVGYYYFSGVAVPQNYKKAYHYFKLSSQKGYALACNYLGIMYESGHGPCSRSIAKALFYYSKGVQGGNHNAMFNVGLIYELGKLNENRDCDLPLALHYYKMALNAHPGYGLAASRIRLMEEKLLSQVLILNV